MKRRKYLMALFLASNIFILNCSVQEKNIKTFDALQASCYEKYKSKDIEIAEKGLRELETLANDYENEGVEGIDYYVVRGYLYIRLYLIYIHKGKAEEAEDFLNKGIAYFNNEKKLTKEEKKRGIKEYIQVIKNIDRRQGVLWAQKG